MKVCRTRAADRGAEHVVSVSIFPSSYADMLADELSEEDQQLKDELEMLVERLKVRQFPQSVRSQQ